LESLPEQPESTATLMTAVVAGGGVVGGGVTVPPPLPEPEPDGGLGVGWVVLPQPEEMVRTHARSNVTPVKCRELMKPPC
jgi:hypothetical protein